MTLERDGVEVDHPDWRRDPVRGLFALSARHRTVTRRSATEVLWPDFSPYNGAYNLRRGGVELGLSPSPELRRLDRALAAPGELGTFSGAVGRGEEPGMAPGPGGGHL